MKTLTSTLACIFLFLCFNSLAQFPEAINYQTVIRNSSGEVIQNQEVSLRFSIREGSPTGTILYSEYHNVQTNNYGLVNLGIGNGILVSGSKDNVDWKSGGLFLQTELDASGGSSYVSLGSSEFQTVPYAIHSGSTSDNYWEQLENNIYYDNGNLGIGTSSPLGKLNIVSEEGTSAFVQSQNIGLVISDAWWNSGNELEFLDAVGEKRIVVTDSYRLGIGTSSPNSDLEINGNNEPSGLRVAHGSAYPNLYSEFKLAGASGLLINASAGGSWAKISFQTESNTRMLINHLGNVGIGTTSPLSKLNIVSEEGTSGFLQSTSKGLVISDAWWNSGNELEFQDAVGEKRIVVTDSYRLGIGTGNPEAGLHVKGSTFPNSFMYIQSDEGSDAGFRLYEGDEPKWHIFNNSYSEGLQIYNQSGQTAIFFTQVGGDVCIGTTTPAAGYKLSVAGRVACEEVLVEYSGSWPDYVFEDNYNLPDLYELEIAIKSKKHLPGLPSAKKVKNDGFHLADMQSRLLQKVEELTLYTIEQEKKIDQLSHEIELLKGEYGKLIKSLKGQQ